jgi:hypothetical protein
MKTMLLLGVLWGLPAVWAVADERPNGKPADAVDQESEAGNRIVVEVAGGRKFIGQVDPHTDQTRLWLRRQQGSAVVLRPLAWQRVVRVQIAGAELSGEELLAIVKELRPTASPPAPPPGGMTEIVLSGAVGPREAVAATNMGSLALSETPRVCSLAIEATTARWNANVEADGLLVRVYPLAAAGGVVPVRGSLEIEWIGRRTDVIQPEASFCRLGHWTVQVSERDFGLDGAVYRLPFQSVHPEFDLAVALYGAVHARLSVPGQGTFEATASMVRGRPASVVRDQLQRATGHRFFPQETTGDGRH